MFFSRELEKSLVVHKRESVLDVLKIKMNEMHVDEHELWWYLDTRKIWFCSACWFRFRSRKINSFRNGMTNIRDVIPFPRTPKTLSFMGN